MVHGYITMGAPSMGATTSQNICKRVCYQTVPAPNLILSVQHNLCRFKMVLANKYSRTTAEPYLVVRNNIQNDINRIHEAI